MAIQKIRRRIERLVVAAQATLQTPGTLVPGQSGFAIDTNSFVIRDLDENLYTTYVVGGSGGLSPVAPTVGYFAKFASGSTVDNASMYENTTHLVVGKPISLLGDPVEGYEAANKSYIDDNFVNKAGDTMTGDLTLANDPTSNLHAATKQYVDNKIPYYSGTTAFELRVLATNQLLGSGNLSYQRVGNIVTLKIPQTVGGILTTESILFISGASFPIEIFFNDADYVQACKIFAGGVGNWNGIVELSGINIQFRNNDNTAVFTSGSSAGIGNIIFSYPVL